ncbi:ribonuclease H-like domain-containing protein [Tanacetum coccineum]
MTEAKRECGDAIKSRFGANLDKLQEDAEYFLKQTVQQFSESIRDSGAGVSTEDENQKFLRSLPSAWSQASLIMRTKPGVDSLSFDDLYNNLRIKRNQDNRRRDTLENSGIRMGARTSKEEGTLKHCKLLNTQMSANDKFGLGYGDHRYDGILSYENEVLQSVFMNKERELEKQPMYDRFADGMHVVPPPMIGNYMPFGVDIEVDYSQFTYDPKQTQPSEFESQSSLGLMLPIVEEYDQICEVLSLCFWGSKGYITGKGKIKTGKLDFEDVCFVKELQHFNLFSVSQMCDKKNKVLFTESECLVLSPEFKLPDENQVLLKIPRQNNMYSFNLENIVPSGGLACLIAKATTDESKQTCKGKPCQRCDNGTKFKNKDVIEFYGSKEIKKEYSNAKTPQQNGVAERKNRTLIEAARTMLADSFFT